MRAELFGVWARWFRYSLMPRQPRPSLELLSTGCPQVPHGRRQISATPGHDANRISRSSDRPDPLPSFRVMVKKFTVFFSAGSRKFIGETRGEKFVAHEIVRARYLDGVEKRVLSYRLTQPQSRLARDEDVSRSSHPRSRCHRRLNRLSESDPRQSCALM